MIQAMDWHNTRYLNFIPEHFIKISTELHNKLRMLNWIEKNTTGRYAYTSGKIAFENKQDVVAFQMFYIPLNQK